MSLRRRPGRRPRLLLLAAGAASAVLIAVGLTGFAASTTGSTAAPLEAHSAPVDLRGNAVAPDQADIPAAAAVQKANPVEASGGDRFSVPSVGLNVPLGALDEVDGAIVPPGFRSAYLVRNRGASPQDPGKGTVFVVMHAVRGGVGPGNYLIDVDGGRAAIARGAEIAVQGKVYVVSGAETVGKTDLPRHAEVWANTPDRLVVITCLLRPADKTPVDNVVIFATLRR
ncbi:class F sortase [Sinomonas sp. ASV322]|uniref:class F sortase n=1 Tax=Sinomonas sp. ASV322 TaxID=3041920 RepID=UPI0027DC4891|nr:class F sortase [Sinomonas sp. ASV322]MDQ4502439.1 class F sortase [Sinomonas sp. ASV322]